MNFKKIVIASNENLKKLKFFKNTRDDDNIIIKINIRIATNA